MSSTLNTVQSVKAKNTIFNLLTLDNVKFQNIWISILLTATLKRFLANFVPNEAESQIQYSLTMSICIIANLQNNKLFTVVHNSYNNGCKENDWKFVKISWSREIM